MVLALLAWTLFAFGGVYPSTLAVPAVLCVAIAIVFPPWAPAPVPRDRARGIDGAWLLIVAAAAMQTIPLPPAILQTISPARTALWRLLSLDAREGRWLPLSVDLRASVWAIGIAAGAFVLFAAARRMFESGGVRTVVRGVAVLGLAVAALALAQDATSSRLMYWRWAPLEEGAAPFGPFVNRNHFATWVILAWPLCFGYLVAHAAAEGASRRRSEIAPAGDAWRRRVLRAMDARAILLTGSMAVMAVALVSSLSRSGLLGIAAAGLMLLVLGARPGRTAVHGSRSFAAWSAALAAFALALIVLRVDPMSLSSRVSAAPAAVADRTLIWRDTMGIVRDFWLTGTGAGTYETAMLVYQRAMSGVRFNQAHNHYLQAAAEGGVLMGIPLLLAFARVGRAAAERLRLDRSGMFWIRAGAAAALTGAAVQSVWETGLTVPANAALAAVVAAILVHTPAAPASSTR